MAVFCSASPLDGDRPAVDELPGYLWPFPLRPTATMVDDNI